MRDNIPDLALILLLLIVFGTVVYSVLGFTAKENAQALDIGVVSAALFTGVALGSAGFSLVALAGSVVTAGLVAWRGNERDRAHPRQVQRTSRKG